MNIFGQVGDFCPDESCADYGKLQKEQQFRTPLVATKYPFLNLFSAATISKTGIAAGGDIFVFTIMRV